MFVIVIGNKTEILDIEDSKADTFKNFMNKKGYDYKQQPRSIAIEVNDEKVEREIKEELNKAVKN